MRQAAVWSAKPPDAKAMASSAPFACDSMPLEHWLQYIFIPKLNALILRQQALPRNIAVAPMAEQMFVQQSGLGKVITTLRSIDQLLSEQGGC